MTVVKNITKSLKTNNFVGNKLIDCTSTPSDNQPCTLSRCTARTLFAWSFFLCALVSNAVIPEQRGVSARSRWNHLIHRHKQKSLEILHRLKQKKKPYEKKNLMWISIATAVFFHATQETSRKNNQAQNRIRAINLFVIGFVFVAVLSWFFFSFRSTISCAFVCIYLFMPNRIMWQRTWLFDYLHTLCYESFVTLVMVMVNSALCACFIYRNVNICKS